MVEPAKKRILFVDDEPAILAGLENLLYRERKKWQMVFALGAEKAFDALQAATFDVVVSDMKMPGIDGAELLNRVRDQYPSTARIMLSGYAEREAIVRALPAVHQLLSKPCEAIVLRDALERGTHDSLGETPVRRMMVRLDKLQSPPAIHRELTAALERPNASAVEVAAIVARDPASCVKILQLVNSAYFGAGEQPTSVEHAVASLGVERLRYIVETASVFSADPSPVIEEIQQSSARAARVAGRLLPGRLGETAYAAALLHDVGRAVIALELPADQRAIVDTATAQHRPAREVERERLGVGHAEVGAQLLELWGLPRSLADVVRFHHDPGSAPPELRQLAAVVHVADALTDSACRPGSEPGRDAIDVASVERAGFAGQLNAWQAIASSLLS